MPTVASISPEQLLWAYSQGFFPMAQHRRSSQVQWYSPDPRALLPLESMHLSRSLRRRIKRGDYKITRDRCFEQVIRCCAQPRPEEPQTWINSQIREVFLSLHAQGHAHSVEAWLPIEGHPRCAALPTAPGATPLDRMPTAQAHELGLAGKDRYRLAGGIYGLAIGGAFFAESMFSRAVDASKVCLAMLVDHLRQRGFTLLDVQFPNPHLEQFGVMTVPRSEYLRRLETAVKQPVSW